MNMSLGKNTIQGKRLLEIIEQSEAYDAQKKAPISRFAA